MGDTTQPDNLAETGQRDAAGRFVAGHKGMGGRPRGYDLRAEAEALAAEHKMTVGRALGLALWGQLALAPTDTAAAKLVFSILGDTLTPDDAKESLAALIAATWNRKAE